MKGIFIIISILCDFCPGKFYEIPAMGAIRSTVQVMASLVLSLLCILIVILFRLYRCAHAL